MYRKGKKINTYPSPTLPYPTQQATGCWWWVRYSIVCTVLGSIDGSVK